MNNKKWYYLCDLDLNTALEFTQIPAVWGNVTGMADVDDATLADMSWAGHSNRAFFAEDSDRLDAIDVTSMMAAKAVGEEVAKAQLRTARDAMLAHSDSAVLPDRWDTYSSEKKQIIAAYRQALRDLPTGYVFDAVWPTIPDELAFLRAFA